MLRTPICVCLVSLIAFLSVSGQLREVSKSASNVASADVEFIEGKVLLIVDGDQFRVKTAGETAYTVRLHGIDAPEDIQSNGPESRKALEELALGKDVRVVVLKRDSLGRYVGTAFIGGQDVAVKLLERGHAWHYKRFSGEQTSNARERYALAELKARDGKMGLWADAMPVPPWEYRDSLAAAGPSKQAKQEEPPAREPAHAEGEPKPAAAAQAGRRYLVGPRGGCYYLNDAGDKIYVKDRSRCAKP